MLVPYTPPHARHTSNAEEQLAEQQKLMALPVHNAHAAGIDVGDTSH